MYTIKESFSKRVELRLDISKFYTTIYSHSITWALLDKEVAKEYFAKDESELKQLKDNDDHKAVLYLKSKAIDECLRNCQGKQSIGIPVGPDTSYILAELITARIDYYLLKEYPEIKGCRYYDDYYLYTDTKEKAESILKFIQKILFEFGLEINERKVSIKDFPFAFEDEFSPILSNFSFKNRFESSIRTYFSLVWGFAEKSPDKMGQIFRYSLKIFENKKKDRIVIPDSSWNIFENLLFKTALLDSTILDVVYNILSEYESNLNLTSLENLKIVIINIFDEHILTKQHYEISWALWICKRFNIKISNKNAEQIFDLKDSVSCLILLY
ncbi:hypothetical protein EZS27_014681 [termite gut metagenome]|uniref:Reverse transcriptase domain-containing protein n=1 Tax=termite gut metagenome TaxID=433724 RepID=A0A5J4RUW6_9ZZZZ